MFDEHLSDVKFDIRHVLFIDIVGYSKLVITEQSERLETLKKILRGTEQFRLAEAEGAGSCRCLGHAGVAVRPGLRARIQPSG